MKVLPHEQCVEHYSRKDVTTNMLCARWHISLLCSFTKRPLSYFSYSVPDLKLFGKYIVNIVIVPGIY